MLTALVFAVLAADPSVPVEQITAAYDENVLRADSLYRAKELEVTGKMLSLKLDEGGAAIIKLQGAKFTKFVAATRVDPRLVTFRKGDKITLRCTIHGLFEMDVLGEVCTLK